MTVTEFMKYIESKRHIGKIVFWTENQKRYNTMNPCKIRMSFTAISVHENPSVVCLQDGANTMTFDRVSEIQLDSKSSVLGDVVTVICGGSEYAYTIVVE